jgi:magnesium-transporting ATPase (P-type)
MLDLFAQAYELNNEQSFSLVSTLNLFLIATLLNAIGLWKVFEKAGEKGWKALVPIYSTWTLFEISGKPGWWALLLVTMFIPIISIFVGLAFTVMVILASLALGRTFGKSSLFSVVWLFLFSTIGYLILGFGDATYTKPSSQTTDTHPVAPVNPT